MSTNHATKHISVIVAYSHKSRAIGKQGKLPWNVIKKDLKYFNDITTKTVDPNKVNAVVMGRLTWNSIPRKYRPLNNRINAIVTNSNNGGGEYLVFTSLLQAVEMLKADESIETVYIIGGSRIYSEAFQLDIVDEVYATIVYAEYPGCDTFFPKLPDGYGTVSIYHETENGTNIDFVKYIKRPQVHEEYQYLDLVKRILVDGHVKTDRTGTGTKSIFGATMRFSLENDVIPLLTTKRVFWRGVAIELLWFISGKTDAGILKSQNVGIWNENSSRVYLDSIGLCNNQEGDLGPVYGFQWRHFGAKYSTMNEDYSNKGFDQLAGLIDQIKKDPNSRRLVLSAWNPPDIKKMALPPCHVMCQFYVSDGELSCQMYQRSADMGLGVPFNIASYALLTRLIAKCCGLKCKELIHVIGDCHVYLNHVEALLKQLENKPTPFPTLKINGDNTSIDNFKYEDFELVGYNSAESIKMKMAV